MNPTKELDRWMEFNSTIWSDKTKEVYRPVLANFIKWVRANRIPFLGLTYKHIRLWMEFNKVKGKGQVGQYVMWQASLVKRWIAWIVDEGKMVDNPVKFSHLPRFGKSRANKYPFSFEEYQQVLRAIRDYRFKIYGFWMDAAIIGWDTGFRCSDVALLEWRQVDLEKECIRRVLRKTRRMNKEIIIPIEPETYEVLLRIKETNEFPGNPFVLPLMAGYYKRYRALIVSQFRKICDWAGLPNHSFHSFRHSFVTRLLNAGVDPVTICSLTGHGLKQLNTYEHLSLEAKANALSHCREAMHQARLVRAGMRPRGPFKFTSAPFGGEIQKEQAETPGLLKANSITGSLESQSDLAGDHSEIPTHTII